MKILVLSDSHSSLSYMRRCLDVIKPDAAIHLGDYVQDGEAMAEEYPGIRFYQVAGNCDRNRVVPGFPEVLVDTFSGCRIYYTHGHIQKVKTYLDYLIMDASRCNADIVLYGHTHQADCRLLENGMWILNPGSCGYYGGSVGVITIASGKVQDCVILQEADLEDV